MKVRASDISGVLKAVFEFGGFCGATKFWKVTPKLLWAVRWRAVLHNDESRYNG